MSSIKEFSRRYPRHSKENLKNHFAITNNDNISVDFKIELQTFLILSY